MSAFKVASLNANSLVETGRLAEVEGLLSQGGVDVCLFQETFFKTRHDHEMVEYDLVRVDRPGARGGGTAVAVKKGLAAVVVPVARLARLSVLEATGIVINLNNGHKLYCISVYYRGAMGRFIADLVRIFDSLALDRSENQYVIGGDFNALHQAWGFRRTYPRGSELFRFIEDNQPLFGTRVLASEAPSRPLQSSFPDLFIVKDTIDFSPIPDDVVNCLGTVDTTFSDHRMVIVDFRVCGARAPPIFGGPLGRMGKLRRGVPTITSETLGSALFSLCEKRGFDMFNVNRLAEATFTWEQLNAMNESFTEMIVDAMEVSVVPRRARAKAYIPAKIRCLIAQKKVLVRILFDNYRSHLRYSPIMMHAIIRLRRHISNLAAEIRLAWKEIRWRQDIIKLERIRSAEPRDFYKELKRCYQYKKTSNAQGESFLFDDTVANRHIVRDSAVVELGAGKLLVSGEDVDQILGNILEDTFNPEGNIGLGEGVIPDRKVEFGQDLRSDENCGERFISPDGLDEIISDLNGKHSSGPDGIPNSIIKMLPAYFRRILLIILNNSINLGRMPRLWKISTVVFIRKDGSKVGDPNNYRPISLLSNLSKILETFYVKRLEKEIEAKSLISDNQFGFRRGVGTVNAIGTLVNKIVDHRLYGRSAAVVFVDLKKAFDSVNHGRLLELMSRMRVDGEVVGFFGDFLRGRRFISSRAMRSVVEVGDLNTVPHREINSGVLQGSISGPTLFILFVDEVLRRIPDSVAYADDLAVVCGRTDLGDLALDTQVRFNHLQLILDQRGLTINISKTKIVLFRETELPRSDQAMRKDFHIRSEHKRMTNGVSIPSQRIEVVESFNYLGVTLDQFLKFNLHVDRVVESANKVYRNCAKILQLQELEPHRRVWLYKAVVRPFLTYGCPVWVLLTPMLMKRLVRAEYHVLRSIFGRARRRNGRYFSYRSRLKRAKIPGVDYQIIRLARRHLIKLDGKAGATVDQVHPYWAPNILLIKKRLFTPESTMFIDALGLLQDEQYRNIFYALDRHGLSNHFNLDAVMQLNAPQKPCRRPTKYDIRSCQIQPPWGEWVIPERYRRQNPN